MISFAQKLKESGLTAQDAKILGLRHLTAPQTAKLASHYREVPSMLIPYFDAHGKAMDFHRVRYLADLSSFSRGRKYDGPSGAHPRAYFPKLVRRWHDIGQDPTLPITITEGELKAACGAKKGIHTIGLGGVWNWRSKKLGIELIPELEDIIWKERLVDLCFDSDIVLKPQVRQALNFLARELAQRGAKVRQVLLPQQGEEKVGLDDFLVARGRAAYDALERLPMHLSEGKRADFLARHVYLESEDVVFDVEKNLAYKSKQHFINATQEQKILTDSGKLKPLAADWYDCPERVKLPGYTFNPTTTDRIIPNEGLNLFRGFAVEPRRGSVEPMLKVIDTIVGKRPEIRKWFLQWLAYPLQYPGTKLHQCVFVYHHGQAIGKSSIGDVMRDIYGKKHSRNLSEQDFFGQWNDYLEDGLFIQCDELSFDGSKKSRSVFKRLITSESAVLSNKYRTRTQVDNHCNFYMTSNSPGGLPLERDNRRVLVIEAQGTLTREYMNTVFHNWRNHEDGPAHWFHYLLQLDTSDFNPRAAAPTTAEESLAVQSSGHAVDLWMVEAFEQAPFRDRDLWTTREILSHYQLSTGDSRTQVAAITRALAQIPDAIKVKPVHTSAGLLQSLWAIRNRAEWGKAPAKKLREAWENEQVTGRFQ